MALIRPKVIDNFFRLYFLKRLNTMDQPTWRIYLTFTPIFSSSKKLPWKFRRVILPLCNNVMRDLALLIQKMSRGVHGLSIGDLDTSDKMNATKAVKISLETVKAALKTFRREETEATRLYLRIMRYMQEWYGAESQRDARPGC